MDAAATSEPTKPTYYYKSIISTKDGIKLYDTIIYNGFILGKREDASPSKPLKKQPNKKHTEQFVLMRYSVDAKPQILWQGEITNFARGYNLEIFPHPESVGDYLIFTHSASKKASSHCYWLTTQETAPAEQTVPVGRCINITAAQSKLTGLKYIHYHAGKFVGVFHRDRFIRFRIGMSHYASIYEIKFSFRDTKNHLIFNGSQININKKYTGSSITSTSWICSRIPEGTDELVFWERNHEFRYNILTQEISRWDRELVCCQPNDTPLVKWDNPEIFGVDYDKVLITYIIPDSTTDLLVRDSWGDRIYIYKSADDRFHLVDAPHTHFVGYNDIMFITPKFIVITKINTRTGKRTYFLTELDTEKLTLKIVCQLPDSAHSQSIGQHHLDASAIILRDHVYDPIYTQGHSTHVSPFANRQISKFQHGLSAISQPMSSLVAKFALKQQSSKAPGF